MTNENWDRELTPSEFIHLDKRLKRERIDASLSRKVREVERWAASGKPPPKYLKLAGNRARLRRWSDPAKKLWSWSDDAPDDPSGRNKFLLARWEVAIHALGGIPGVASHAHGLSKDAQIKALRAQVTELINNNSWLESQLKKALSKLKSKTSERTVNAGGSN
ncbi:MULTISPECIES: hypothetical protein [Rhizobium]|uniref:hypothetical protein n=1 Tax=Rhizobium TaxID=379 RepID=UPI0010301190|nr:MULTISPECIES: hypothetical protein [Rhizobium]TAX51859.1 hypothetical protein ELH99_17605 [Rhizobium leguminosarum]TBB50211.1 hypothetical protein ELH46_16190 [Rhizobium ruizarguesonis]TCB17951.1 hypothetical protein E0J18_12840 [Rhizobium leguminosarum bv. viciae]